MENSKTYTSKKKANNTHVYCCYFVAQLCLTLCDPKDCSPPGSSVHGILQARTLEWVAISFSRGSSQPRDQAYISCIGRWFLYRWVTWEVHDPAPIIITMCPPWFITPFPSHPNPRTMKQLPGIITFNILQETMLSPEKNSYCLKASCETCHSNLRCSQWGGDWVRGTQNSLALLLLFCKTKMNPK